jgi:cytoskeletal protein RodZ
VTTPVPPEEDAPADPGPDAPKKHKGPWIWICGGLAVVAIGALVWAFVTRSDLNDTQSQLDSTEQELASAQQKLDVADTPTPTPTETPSPEPTETPADDNGSGLLKAGALAAAKSLYDDVRQQLGATQDDLAQTQQELDEANQQAAQAEKDAAAAKQKADDAGNATEKAQAEAEQAQAETKAAQSKAAIAADCAKAYISVFGTLFEGDDVKAQVDKVRGQIEQITADCKTAFEAS